MASDVYTLPELVDLALKTPEIGAVNFNIVRIILHKIITECKFQNVTAEWKPVPPPTLIEGISVEDKLPDHPILTRIADEKETTDTNAEDTAKSDVRIPPVSKGKEIKAIGKTDSRDTVALKEIIDEPTATEKSEETRVKAEKEAVKVTPKVTISKKKPVTSKRTPDSDEPTDLVSGSNMWELWELKKLIKRVEALDEGLNSIVHTVDEVWQWKESKTKRFQMHNGEDESDYFGPTVGREEFEDTIDEIGEALTLLRTKQKEQKENCDEVNEDIIKEMQLRPKQEEVNEGKEELNKKLNTLSKAVRSMQELMKDVIFPETCGTTKCICCKRKAHLPLSGMVIERKKKIYDDSKKRNVSVEKTSKSPSELHFTTACLKRLIGDDGMRKIFEEKSSEAVEPTQDQHPEQPVFSKHLINLDAFEVTKLTSDFAPLRHDCIHLPSNRPKQAPVTISVGTAEAKGLLKRYPVR